MSKVLTLGVAEFVLMLKDEMSRDASEAMDKVEVKGESLSRGFEVAAVAATALGGAIVGGMAVAAGAFMESEKATAQLDAVLKSTGGTAGMTKEALLELADSLQQVTTYDDEAIIGAESLLLTFTKVGKDVFPEAIKTILDMSTALGTDLQGATIQVGKALNDPIKGVTALSKVGVSFTADQKEMIKAMVESGDVMGAQKLILAELAVEFGGSAAAAADTFSGKLQQINNSLGNLWEAIGAALGGEGTGGMKDFLTQVRDTVDSITAWVEANPGLASGIVQTTAAVGGLLLVVGPLLGLLSNVAMITLATSAIGGLGTAATAAAGGGGAVAAAGGVAAAASTAAAGGGIAGLTAAVMAFIGTGTLLVGAGVLGAAVLAELSGSAGDTREAYADLEESQRSLEQAERDYIEMLREKGVAIDQTRMASLNEAQQRAYLAAQEAAERDALARAWLQYYLERVEGETEFGRVKNLMLNENLDAEEAAYLVSKHLSEEKLRQVMQSSAAETDTILAELGFQRQESEATQQAITALAAGAAMDRQQLYIDSSVALVQNERDTLAVLQEQYGNFFSYLRYVYEWWRNAIFGTPMESQFGNLLEMDPAGAPQMATGGLIRRGGLVRVHKDEDIILPSFAEVIPKQHTQAVRNAIDGGVSGGVTVQFHGPVQFGNDMDAARVGRVLGRQVRHEMQLRGVQG